ncbi:Tetratricopeptide-like helical domain superfamily [Sesbania bispinosa]|nr:Tetratricopeptide-like helical domain superfamily [Sesbania bispinosa]
MRLRKSPLVGPSNPRSRHKKGHSFSRNDFIETKLVILYAKCGVSDVANRLFRSLRKQSLFSWAAIVGLHARTGRYRDSLLSYVEMLENGFWPDNFVIPNALKACGALQWVNFGKGVHGYVVKMMGFKGCVYVATSLSDMYDTRDVGLGMMAHAFCVKNEFDFDVVVSSGIVDMYAKCGRMDYARRSFSSATKKDVLLWNTMLGACAEMGLSGEGLKLFLQMQLESVPPNVVSWNSVIFGFFRNGQAVEAQNMFSEMRQLDEALRIVQIMPSLPDAHMLGSLLGACGQNHEIELPDYMAKWLLKLEANNSGNCVALSDLYATKGKWDKVSNIRGPK